jgi:multidrug efflux pump subunit AcrA (membrane-fusion protein)
MMPLLLRAPRAAIVRSIAVSNGSKVAASQLIVSLDSEEEQKTLLEITQALAELDAYAVSVSEHNVAARLVELQAVVSDSQLVMNDDIETLKLIKLEIALGARNMLALYPISESLVVSSDAVTKAKSALDQYKYDVESTRAYNVELKKLAILEEANARAQIGRMEIATPSPGVVTVFASVGQYVAMGFVLGEVR